MEGRAHLLPEHRVDDEAPAADVAPPADERVLHERVRAHLCGKCGKRRDEAVLESFTSA